MAKWNQTKHEGVRYREHPTRKNGVRKDRYYAIRYYVEGKRVEESLGWETDWQKAELARKDEGKATGRTLEQESIVRRAWLQENHAKGNGPRTLKEKKTLNDADREAKAANLKREAEAQKTLSEYWKDSYFPAAKRLKKESSWSKEEQHFRLWIEPLFGIMQLRSIKLEQWDELVKTLSSVHPVNHSKKTSDKVKEKTAVLSQRSREYITGTLRRILKHAYDRRMIDDAPPTGKRVGVSGPGNNRRLRVISHEEERAIMEHLSLSDPHAWRITRFVFLTGCRASEAFNLVWANIDSSRGCLVFPETKNNDSRTLPLTPFLKELFDAMETGSPGAPVFTKSDGSLYYQAPNAFDTVVEKLGLNEGRSKRDRIVFHSIRHTVATRLARDLGPRDLMDVMGWRTVQMAMRYVHANEEAKSKALTMLGAAHEIGKVLPFRPAEASK